MKLRKTKRGFTIIELVIVIGVIGILAAVLIPTFINLSNKAQEASNQSFVKDLNTQLAMRAVSEGKNKTMHEAVLDARDIGYDVEKLTPVNGRRIVWDSKADQFALFNDDGSVYFKTAELQSTGTDLWEIVKNADQFTRFNKDDDTGRSIYLAYARDDVAGLKVGFDAGSQNVTSITYDRSGATSSRDVLIRTNGGNLTIDAKNDNVTHYGSTASVNVIDVASSSYHENGTVQFFEVAAGHIVLEAKAEVTAFHFTATNGAFKNADNKTISIDVSKLPEENLPDFSRDPVTIGENGTFVAEVKSDSSEYIWLFGNGIKEQMVVTSSTAPIAENGVLQPGVTTGCESGSIADQVANPAKRNEQGQLVDNNNQVVPVENAIVEPVPSKEDVKNAATMFNSGNGSIEKPYVITCREEFLNIDKMYDKGYKYYTVDATSTKWAFDSNGKPHMDGSNWPTYETAYGARTNLNLNGSLEGNGLVVDNLDSWLFNIAGNGEGQTEISDLTINANIVCAATGTSALLRTVGTENIIIDSVTVHGNISGGGNDAAYVGYGSGNYYDSANAVMHITFNNCVSDVKIESTGQAGGFIGHIYCSNNDNSQSSVTINNSKYWGMMINGSGSNHGYISGNVGGYGNIPVTATYTSDFNTTGIPSSLVPTSGNTVTYKVDVKYTYNRSSLTNLGTITQNADYSYSVNAASGAVSAKAYIQYSYDTDDAAGNGLVGFVLIDEDLTIANGKVTTSVKYANYVLNGTTSGNTYSIDNPSAVRLGKIIIYINQYDADGNSLGFSSLTIKD